MNDQVILDTQKVKPTDQEPNVVGVSGMSKLVYTTLIVVDSQEDKGGVTSVDDPLVKDMHNIICSMDLGGGDESDT
jgi:hypothetical protein